MKDNIASRISRIITGTASSIVTKIEGLTSDAVLEQAINEVDSAIDEVRVEMGSITAQKHNVTKTMTRLNSEHEELDGRAALALEKGREDLVEAALGRQTDIESQLPALEADLLRLNNQEDTHKKALSGLIAKRNEMEDELTEYRHLVKNSAVAGDSGGGASGPSAIDKAANAEHAFDRILQRTTGIRRSALTASASEASKLAELANLERNTKIQQKLEALKARKNS